MSELFENKAKTFSLDKAIVVDNIGNAAHAPDFIPNFRRKN